MHFTRALVLLSALTAAFLAGPSAIAKLNVVVIMADDLGWSDIGCQGSDLYETPNIDRLADRSMRFTDAYAAAAICSPTRAAFQTGKYPARLGMTIWHEWAVKGPGKSESLIAAEAEPNLPRREITIAEALKAAGYHTFHVGKWHAGDAAHYPETQGYDVNIGGTHWGAPSTFFWPYRGPFGAELRYIPGLIGGQPGEYLTDRLTSEAIQLIEKHRNRPFFLNLCFHAVHTPIEGKKELVEYYREKLKEAKRGRQARKHTHPAYAAMVHTLDRNVGRLVSKLDALELAERTLVVFTSDNGGVVHRTRWGVVTSNKPFRSGKGSLYEGGIRVPLIFHWPGVTRAGSTSSQPVSTQDLYPTILAALELGAPQGAIDGFDGFDLTPLLRDPGAKLARDALFWHYPHFYPTTTPVTALRSGRHKLLRFYEDDRIELYDLALDSGESRNLAPEKPELAARLRRRLDRWLKDVGARLPRRRE